MDFIAGFANTAADPTQNVNSGGAVTVKGPGGGALIAGDIALGVMHTVRHDGTNWRLLNPAASGSAGTVTQAAYDLLFPVTFVILTRSETTPTVPTGITATWTRMTGTQYLRTADGAVGAGGNLVTTAGGNHDHGGVTGVYTGNTAQYSSGGQSSALTGTNHTHTIADSGTHQHSIEPSYRSFVVWERTA